MLFSISDINKKKEHNEYLGEELSGIKYLHWWTQIKRILEVYKKYEIQENLTIFHKLYRTLKVGRNQQFDCNYGV